MPLFLGRAFAVALALPALAACTTPSPSVSHTPPAATTTLGVDLGSAPGRAGAAAAAPSPTPASAPARAAVAQASPHDSHGHGAPAAAQAGEVWGHGMVDAVDTARRRVTLTHDPIPELGWPTMTMVFQAPGTVDIARVRPGDHVDFSLMRGHDTTYELRAIRPSDH